MRGDWYYLIVTWAKTVFYSVIYGQYALLVESVPLLNNRTELTVWKHHVFEIINNLTKKSQLRRELLSSCWFEIDLQWNGQYISLIYSKWPLLQVVSKNWPYIQSDSEYKVIQYYQSKLHMKMKFKLFHNINDDYN